MLKPKILTIGELQDLSLIELIRYAIRLQVKNVADKSKSEVIFLIRNQYAMILNKTVKFTNERNQN